MVQSAYFIKVVQLLPLPLAHFFQVVTDLHRSDICTQAVDLELDLDLKCT